MDYIRTKNEDKVPQLLQVRGDDGVYRLVVLHASAHEERKSEQSRHPAEHRHDIYHFVLYISGENRFCWRGRECEGRRGVLAMVSPGEPHDFSSCVKGAFAYAEVTFQLENAGGLLAWPFHQFLSALSGMTIAPVESTFSLTERQTRTVERNIRAIVDGMNDGTEAGVYDAYLALTEALQSATRLCRQLEIGFTRQLLSPLEVARREIEQNFCEHLTLEDISAVANLSKSHFCRSFDRAFGVSPLAYQIELRIRAAEVLLRTTNLRGKEIAPRLGFCDEYAFSKAFKKSRGISPGAYRSQRSV